MFRPKIEHNQTIEMKWAIGKKWKAVKIRKENNRLFLKYGFSKKINQEIKTSFEGYKYHGFDDVNPRKVWSISDSAHNWFQIAFLAKLNPYSVYDVELPKLEFRPRYHHGKHQEFDLFEHQKEDVRHGMARHYALWAVEMGCGKTLAAIEIMERSGFRDWVWVAPKSALAAAEIEFKNWGCKIRPRMCTYRGLQKMIQEWPDGKPAPRGVIFDESSRLKNERAQQTQAAKHLANSIRAEHGWDGFVIEMSGSPAPKAPTDWYSQCEIAMPGFLREGSVHVLKNLMSIIEQRESNVTGGTYPHLVTWRDNENKCNVCGELKEHHLMKDMDHLFEPSINEVKRLYKRMKGLVLVQFKRDCLDLPEKQYREIVCKPNQEVMKAAKLLTSGATTGAKLLTSLRSLSDGFQYVEEVSGDEECFLCKGDKVIKDVVCLKSPEEEAKILESRGLTANVQVIHSEHPDLFKLQTIACINCSGIGRQKTYTRKAKHISCPKEDALRDLLDQHIDVGRLVIYGGFTGSVDRITQIVQAAKWDYIRVDGRGWQSSLDGNSEGLLTKFQSSGNRIAFIGQPGAAGMGLTLTASPTIVYYSNDFNAESRIQSEDRIHRPGMDVNRGATIIDLLHLPTDKFVLENLRKKRDLQSMSLGEVRNVIEASSDTTMR